MRVYLDSNVFISLFEMEVGRNSRGLFVEAEMFVGEVKKENHVLVLSDLFFREVEKVIYLKSSEVLAHFEKNMVKTEVVGSDNVVLNPVKGLHFSDYFHVAIAVHFKCACIVTFNVKDFSKAAHLIKIVEPKDF